MAVINFEETEKFILEIEKLILNLQYDEQLLILEFVKKRINHQKKLQDQLEAYSSLVEQADPSLMVKHLKKIQEGMDGVSN